MFKVGKFITNLNKKNVIEIYNIVDKGFLLARERGLISNSPFSL